MKQETTIFKALVMSFCSSGQYKFLDVY
uniref:Uncharacterized protein n=1 Tax=Arundo donax TaxID=35708 RepID=A0A0A8Y6R3_ARUDO